ncbi:MAG: hypothetical protein H5T46_02685 [Archaeoglobi archaeon]|nr:hypothetical protein [Candidatus Mnemosynella sp.]
MIEAIDFGRIRINGVTYEHDVLITSDGEVRDRRRRLSTQSHEVDREEILQILESDPEAIIIGTGMMNRVRIKDDARDLVRERGILLYVYNSRETMTRFNEMRKEGKRVAAIIHITC